MSLSFGSDNVTVDIYSKTLTVATTRGKITLDFGIHVSKTEGFTINEITEETIHLIGIHNDSITVSHHPRGEYDIYTVSWLDNAPSTSRRMSWPSDSFSLSDGHWYGGPETLLQKWPIAESSITLQPYISRDMVSHKDPVYGSFVERYFLNSNGCSVIIDENIPLFLGINENGDGRIVLSGRRDERVCPHTNDNVLLKYDIIVGSDIKSVHKISMREYFQRPVAIPDERMFRYPIWSTWARYKQDVSQQYVLDFAKEIDSRGFPNSQLEIDDMWSTKYGDFSFDDTKFPEPREMLAALRKLNFRVTLWTTPFFNVESETLRKCLDHRWIRDGPEPPAQASLFVSGTSDSPALIRWWNGYGAMVDFTNSKASEWYIRQHASILKDLSIDSFKFDAGEAEFLPVTRGTKHEIRHACNFSKAYVECVSKFGGMVEVRSGYRTQHLPIFVRMMDKYSNWSYTNGLRSLIPTCLTLGIVGYPFILPDMIGGNAYGGSLPTKELYIRWIEITAFMPSMQFSVVPWQYDDANVTRIAKKYVDLHASYVTPIVLRYAKLSTIKHGSPIVRPLWWVNPEDSVTYALGDEFLIGDEVLVAPIVHEGRTSRDIYLPGPEGWKWKDQRTGEIYSSSQWLSDYEIPLEEIAFFNAIKPPENDA